EKLTNQTLQCLRQCGVRNVAPELIELAGREQSPWQNQHLVQLVHQGRLSDTGMPADEHQPRTAACDDVVKGDEQRCNLTVATVKAFRHEQLIGAIALA